VGADVIQFFAALQLISPKRPLNSAAPYGIHTALSLYSPWTSKMRDQKEHSL